MAGLRESDHFNRLTCALFAAQGVQGAPAWLRKQANDCRVHYGGVKLAKQFDAAMAQFETNAEQPFQVFVVGEGNFGKSTLVNALLGQQISKVDFRPETRSFMRYILRTRPADTAKVCIRIDAAHHQWILPSLSGKGKPSGIFEAQEYNLPRALDQLLAEDIDHCRRAEKHNAAERKRFEVISKKESRAIHSMIDIRRLFLKLNVNFCGDRELYSQRGFA